MGHIDPYLNPKNKSVSILRIWLIKCKHKIYNVLYKVTTQIHKTSTFIIVTFPNNVAFKMQPLRFRPSSLVSLYIHTTYLHVHFLMFKFCELPKNCLTVSKTFCTAFATFRFKLLKFKPCWIRWTNKFLAILALYYDINAILR